MVVMKRWIMGSSLCSFTFRYCSASCYRCRLSTGKRQKQRRRRRQPGGDMKESDLDKLTFTYVTSAQCADDHREKSGYF